MFTISVCMIVKNEETVLERILRCIEKFADEIIIVDTGSSDQTRHICHEHNVKLYDFKWCENFSSARNYSFSKASSDYIMWLDADDYITDENIKKIIHLKNSQISTDVYMCKYVMGFENGIPTFEFFRERILKRISNFKWEGFVHEVITPSGKIEYTDIEIEHRKEKENPKMRNLRIYRKAIKAGFQLSPREMYYYARELYFNNYFTSSLRAFKKYLKLKDNYTPNIIDANIIVSKIYLFKNKPNQSLKTLLSLIKNHLPTPEICCQLGQTYENIGNIKLSIFWYDVATITPNPEQGFVRKEFRDFFPYMQLCKIYYTIDQNESRKFFQLAKNIKPNHPAIKFNMQFFE